MHWGEFFGGISIIAVAFLLRKLDFWVYGQDSQEWGTYNYLQKLKGKTTSIMFFILGLIVLLASFAA